MYIAGLSWYYVIDMMKPTQTDVAINTTVASEQGVGVTGQALLT